MQARDAAPPTVVRFGATVLQLGLVLLAIRLFAIEEAFGLVALTPLVFGGFLVHAWLPAPAKLPFFLALSLASFVLVLGPLHGALAIGMAALLFGLCHVPGPFVLRIALLVLAAAGMAALRTGTWRTSWASAVVPVVAAMFMFRGIVYLYDQRTEQRTGQAPASLWVRLSYFFMLPNVCFLLFPVVDYRTFCRTYRERPDSEIHQRGVAWMLRGVVHLLLYRVVYFYLSPPVAEIHDLRGVVLFAVSSFLLYLRISGHFHLIVGLLHLFGFHLPATHNNWLLAASFSDCWRRINVYWTDLMKKVVYYPAFVRLRKRGLWPALVFSTALTFLATWLLHAYQWFWLHGDLPLNRDGMFWALAGALALLTMIQEFRRAGRSRPGASRLGGAVPSWTSALRRALQTCVVFVLICLIWSLWATPSPDRWLSILGRARSGPASQWLALCAGIGGLILGGAWLQRVQHGALARSLRASVRCSSATLTAITTTAGALVVVLLGMRSVQEALGARFASVMRPITEDFLNRRDRERLIASYYDRLVDRGADWGGRVREQPRLDGDDPENFVGSPLAALAGAPLSFEIQPLQREVFLGALFESNRWGMRDQHYELEKPAGTLRIAVLGACSEVGTGVTNPEVWEALAEERLNRELAPLTGRAYEILNFSVPGYTLLHHVTVMREKAARFRPDLVVVSDHFRSSLDLLVTIASGSDPWPEGLSEMLAHVGVAPGMQEPEVRERVQPARDTIEAWALAAIAAECASIDATPLFMLGPYLDPLRGLTDPAGEQRLEWLTGVARDQGYEVLDIRTAFEGETYESAAIVRLENCPSVRGHALLGARFFDALGPFLAAREDG